MLPAQQAAAKSTNTCTHMCPSNCPLLFAAAATAAAAALPRCQPIKPPHTAAGHLPPAVVSGGPQAVGQE
jgi:hypothetical protein